MEENNLRKSLIFNKDFWDPKYNLALTKQFDYEKNNMPIIEKFQLEKFNDELVEPFYKCEKISCYRRNWIKSLISKKKIRFLTKDFDLDLM